MYHSFANDNISGFNFSIFVLLKNEFAIILLILCLFSLCIKSHFLCFHFKNHAGFLQYLHFAILLLLIYKNTNLIINRYLFLSSFGRLNLIDIIKNIF